MGAEMEWYTINGVESIDTPALIIFKDRVIHNIKLALSFVENDPNRLRPHVKTHKTKEVSKLLIENGITKFKCATISEAEMLAMCGAPDILLAYQPTGPKLQRFIELIKKYPASIFSCLADNLVNVKEMSDKANENALTINIFLDLNVGMNRTGIAPGDNAIEICVASTVLPGLKIKGLHAYDGHIRMSDLPERERICDLAFLQVEKMMNELSKRGLADLVIVAGGSTTFPIHSKRKNVECSPGTFVYWDKGYQINYPEQHFLPAAIVITRIISQPDKNKFCLDLGHKSIAAENELKERVYFINAPDIKFVSQSEEHLVIENNGTPYKTGEIFYGIPVHVCPTSALYERGIVVQQNEVIEEWKIIARDRKITI